MRSALDMAGSPLFCRATAGGVSMDELQRPGQQASEEVGFLVGRGQFLADLPVIIGSLDFVMWEVDR